MKSITIAAILACTLPHAVWAEQIPVKGAYSTTTAATPAAATTTQAATFITSMRKASSTTTSKRPKSTATNCPDLFAIQMKGSDGSTWYFRTPESQDGISAQLTTDPESASTYYIEDTKLFLATDAIEDVFANHQTDPTAPNFIFFASHAAKLAHNESQTLTPVAAALGKHCGVSLTYQDNRYLQRYGREIFLTSRRTGGQLQFSDVRAVQPVDLSENGNDGDDAADGSNGDSYYDDDE